jgi:hypothetical protein
VGGYTRDTYRIFIGEYLVVVHLIVCRRPELGYTRIEFPWKAVI